MYNTEYVRELFKLNHRYHNSLGTLVEDIRFIKKLNDKEPELAKFYYEFCYEMYSTTPNTEWGKERYSTWRRDIFAANPSQLLKGDDE